MNPWTEHAVRGVVSASLANTFFGGDDASLLVTLALGAADFVFRPLVAMVFGHLGDRIGGRSSLVMSAALLGIALMPGPDLVDHGNWLSLCPGLVRRGDHPGGRGTHGAVVP